MSSLLDFDATFGALFVGFGASCVAFGILSMQAYSYFRRYPLDVWWYKGLVGVIWLLELVDQAFVGHSVYFYVVTNWGRATALLKAPIWSLILQVALGASVGAIVKVCFGLRVWRFSKHNIPVTGLIMIGALTQLGAAFYFTVMASLKIHTLLQAHELRVVGSLALGLGMATDVVTSAALCWFLRHLRTGYAKDDSIVNQLTIYAINTGLVSSAFSLATLVMYNLMPDNFVYMGLYFVLSKVYANSFYAALNTRRAVRGRGTEAERTTVPTFLMVGQTTTIKPDPQDGPMFSTTLRSQGTADYTSSGMLNNPPQAVMPPLHYQMPYSQHSAYEYSKQQYQIKSWT